MFMNASNSSRPMPVTFDLPAGYHRPEGDGPWDEVCTLKGCDDGKVCMTRIGDVDIPEAKTPSAKHEPPPDMGEYAQGLAQPQE